MKKHLIYVLIFLCTISSIKAQIGVNTTSPDASSILHIESTDKGLLIPKLTTAQRDAIIDPANGLLIFNTDSDEFQFNSNSTDTPIWVAFSLTHTSPSSPGQSLKYSNTDFTTNVNNNSAIKAPIFGNLEWNDNTSLYVVDNTNHTVTITETGRYRVMINASLAIAASGGPQRATPEMRLIVNTNPVGSYASTGYIRNSAGHQESSIHINEVIEVTANDVLSLDIYRTAKNGAVTLRDAGSTNFYIEKIL